MKHTTTVLLVLAIAIPASAATLQMQCAASNVTGLSSGTRMWDSGTSTAIPCPDSTGNGHDAAGTSIYNAPFYYSNVAGSFNSQPYISIGSGDYMLGSIASLSGWGFSSVLVGNFTDIDATQSVMSFGDTDGAVGYLYLNLTADGNLAIGSRNEDYSTNQATTTGLNFLGGDHIFVAEYQADNLFNVYVDGELVLTYNGEATDPGVTSLDRYGVGVTARETVTDIGTGKFAEARYYTGTWSTGEREAMESALASTYGISLVPEPATMMLMAAGIPVLLKRRRKQS